VIIITCEADLSDMFQTVGLGARAEMRFRPASSCGNVLLKADFSICRKRRFGIQCCVPGGLHSPPATLAVVELLGGGRGQC
jgi:hypothetical protein